MNATRYLVGIDAEPTTDQPGRAELWRDDVLVFVWSVAPPVPYHDDGYWPPLPKPDPQQSYRFHQPLVFEDRARMVTHGCTASLVWEEMPGQAVGGGA